MRNIYIISIPIFLLFGCGQKKENTKIEKQEQREKIVKQDSLFKENLINKYKDITAIDIYDGEHKFSIDYQNDSFDRNYLLSPELLDIFKSDSSIFVKYFAASYPTDFIFILKLDTLKFTIEKIKKFEKPKYLIAKAKYLKFIDLKIRSVGDILNENEIDVETEIGKGETIILKGELVEIINE